MSKRTQTEVNAEISTLIGLKFKARPFDAFGGDNRDKIQASIDALNGDVDFAGAAFEDLSGDERDAAGDADDWLHGAHERKPSDTFQYLL